MTNNYRVCKRRVLLSLGVATALVTVQSCGTPAETGTVASPFETSPTKAVAGTIIIDSATRRGFEHPELVSVVQPNLGALRPGDQIRVYDGPDTTDTSLTLDGTAIKFNDATGYKIATIPDSITSGSHVLTLTQSSKAGPVETRSLISIGQGTKAPLTAPIPTLTSQSLTWGQIGFDLTLPQQGDRSAAFTLESAVDRVRIRSSDSGRVTEIDGSGAPIATAVNPPPRPGTVDAATTLFGRFPGATVEFDFARNVVQVRNPVDSYVYLLSGDAQRLDVDPTVPRIVLSRSGLGSIDVQWPDGQTIEQPVAPGERLAVLDSVCRSSVTRCYALVQTADKMFAVSTGPGRSVSVLGLLAPPNQIRAQRYLAFAGGSALAVVPTLDTVEVTVLVDPRGA